jgi:quinol monooxygenase YgiN
MAVRLFVSIKALPGKGDEYLAEALPNAIAVRSEPGCEQYEYFRNAEDPDSFVLVERWTDEALWQTHMGVLRARPPRNGPPLTEGGPKLERYDVD